MIRLHKVENEIKR